MVGREDSVDRLVEANPRRRGLASMVLVAALVAAALENTLTYYVAPLVSELAVLGLAFIVLASARTGIKGARI